MMSNSIFIILCFVIKWKLSGSYKTALKGINYFSNIHNTVTRTMNNISLKIKDISTSLLVILFPQMYFNQLIIQNLMQ